MQFMNEFKRTSYCADISLNDVGKSVVVCGFVQKQRDKGNLIFVDLRDRTGIIQLSFNSDTKDYVFDMAKSLKSEYILAARGIVVKRESVNKDILTGEIEIFVDDMKIFSTSNTPPFHILDDINVKDELRLKYRYIDLRRPIMQHTFKIRHKISKATRDYFDDNGFLEIETPMLIKSTPEGARDYLVPSRVHKGNFFALPQSPQLFKQLLMVSGFDRYMQIVKCFRDEDLRADRQPEFTQIDLEMSFVDQEDVISINEGYIKYLFKQILDIDIPLPIPRITYDYAINTYGTDKPDTRFDLKLVDISDILKDTEFKVFSDVLSKGGIIKGIIVKNFADKLTRKEIDKLTEFVKDSNAKGLVFTRITSENETSSYEKFLTLSEVSDIRERFCATVGDVILIVADNDPNVVNNSLGRLRCEIADKFDLIDKSKFNFSWVVDFPLFEYDIENKRYISVHHPFTSVHDDDISLLGIDPVRCRAKAYDIVLNGCELGGGSIRINNQNLQKKIFEIIGFSKEDAYERFGFLLDAFQYGVPPHGGMAYGLDRLVMLMLGHESIRDVIAFPKVQNSSDIMTNCPSIVDENQLDELNIEIKK